MTDPAACQGVDVNGDEEVCLVAVGYVGTLVERDEDIRLAGIDDPHIGAAPLNSLAHGQGIAQREVLLERDQTLGTAVVAAMTGIDDDDKLIAGSVEGKQSREKKKKREY